VKNSVSVTLWCVCYDYADACSSASAALSTSNNLLLSTRRIDEHFVREQATKLASKKVLYLSLISHIGGRLRSMFGLSGALLQRLLVTT